MNKEEMNELLKLNDKAKKMDRIGNEDAALGLYLEILSDYHPNLYANFERPAIILEKKHRYEEALEILEHALKLITEEKISGDKDKCQSRIDKLKAKVGPREISQTPSPSKKKSIRLPVVIGMILTLGIIAYLILNTHSNYEDVYVDMSELERESELEGSLFTEDALDEEDEAPEITQAMIDFASKALEINIEVTQANIAVSGNTLGFAIFVSPGTSKSKCQNLGTDMVKALGAAATIEYPDLLPPSPVSLGGLYKKYDIIVSVGTSATDIIAKGTKTTSAKKINWRK